MYIDVSLEDIERAEYSDIDPVTSALRRTFKSNRISVSRDYIKIRKKYAKKDKWELFKLPKQAKQYLLTYYYTSAWYDWAFEMKNTDYNKIKRILRCR